MNRRLTEAAVMGATLMFATVLTVSIPLAASGQSAPKPAADPWQVPPTAAQEKNPVESNNQVLRKGLQLYNAKCERCHGSTGKGDGPDGDPRHLPADLSDPDRIAKNTDGDLFYKIWNGRKNPNMPAFKTDLSRTDVWTLVLYVKAISQ